MRIIKLSVLSLLIAALSWAAECSPSFNLDSTHRTVTFNNQSIACFNWQVSYFSSGFSAVSVQFESAPNGATPGVPGTWVAFAGTLLNGTTNPFTATDQATGTFAGSFPWVRIRLVSFSGTGSINGRILGAQLTTATGFPSSFAPPAQFGTAFGTFYPLVDGDWSWVNQQTATYTFNSSNGSMYMTSPYLSATNDFRMRCHTLGLSPPWTVEVAYTQYPAGTNQFFFLDLRQAGGTKQNEYVNGLYNGGTISAFGTLNQCTGDNDGTCAGISASQTSRGSNLIWERVRDNGTVRYWETSNNQINWIEIFNYEVGNGGGCGTAGGCYAGYSNIAPNQVCMGLENNNGNSPASGVVYSYRACASSTGC